MGYCIFFYAVFSWKLNFFFCLTIAKGNCTSKVVPRSSRQIGAWPNSGTTSYLLHEVPMSPSQEATLTLKSTSHNVILFWRRPSTFGSFSFIKILIKKIMVHIFYFIWYNVSVSDFFYLKFRKSFNIKKSQNWRKFSNKRSSHVKHTLNELI